MTRNKAPVVHLVNPLLSNTGGSEWRTLNLYQLLSGHCEVRLWSESRPHPALAAQFPIRRLRPELLRYPRSGVVVFVGVYFLIGRWVKAAWPSRTILIYNTDDPGCLARNLRRLTRWNLPQPEVIFASRMLRERTGGSGETLESLIDIERFSPPIHSAHPDRPFTVGRLSRDTLDKHHANDPGVYRKLAGHGCRLRIMGGTCLVATLANNADIELIAEGGEDPAAFLRNLDCFFYRTSEHWLETYGRVVNEAMACGLAVVCHRRGGYAEGIRHGETGFLFDTEEEGIAQVLALQRDSELRQRIGTAARAAMVELHGRQLPQKILARILGPAAQARP